MTDRRRRFVHVFATFGAGGPQVRAVQLMRHLGAGFEHVVMAMDGRTDARAMLGSGLMVTFAEAPPRGGFFTTRRRQLAWLRAERPDLVLTYNWGAIETVAAAKQLRAPLVHHEDGFGPSEVQRRLRRRSWLRWWLLRGVPVIVPSAVLREIALGEWRLRDRDVHHLVNGVDLERFAPVDEPAQAGGMVIGSVGGLRGEKDYGNLLRAVARLPESVRVCLVGGGALEGSLRDEASRLGIADRVQFAGQTDDTAPWYRRFSVFVLSSRTEQMPIAMLEAMASGLPVVATDVGDVRRILPAEAQACIVPAEDSAALARVLAQLVADAPLRARLGAANRRVAVERYESAICLERFAACYRAAMARSGSDHGDAAVEGGGRARHRTLQVAALREKPHGPARTLFRRMLGPMHVTGVFWYRLHWWCTWYPEWFITLMIHLHTWFFWVCLRRIRAAVASNLEAVMGPCSWLERQRRIWRTFHEFAWCQTERYEQFRPHKKMRFEFAGDATFARMQATDRGFVFFTAHFGNWEMGPLVDELPGGRKFHIVREPEMSAAAQRFVEQLFDRHPARDQFVVHYAGADLALGARLLMALRKGDVIGMPGDRPRAGMGTIVSHMFGRPIDLPPGPAALARAGNAPMVPVFVFREGRRHYRIEMGEPIEVAHSDDKARDIREAVDGMARACERAIERRPHHWFCWAQLWGANDLRSGSAAPRIT